MEGVHEATAGGWSKDGARVLLDAGPAAPADQRPFVVGADGTAVAVPRTGATRFASLRWDGAGLLGLVEVERVHGAVPGRSGERRDRGRSLRRRGGTWRRGRCRPTGVLATVENDRGFSVLRVGARAGTAGGGGVAGRGGGGPGLVRRTGGWRSR